ncbi:hypothetical protein LJC32_00405 [Oscillospiraceae bacterium OttesenSCG-928-F05]|nr:hypothetical protein [Oscillospiraceae bacterium OttesenSCG-928-F05]
METLYSRYFPDGEHPKESFAPLPEDAEEIFIPAEPADTAPPEHGRPSGGPLSGILKNFKLSGLKKGGFSLKNMDTGDLLLILILLLIFLESEDYELLIIIGLVVFLGL